LRKQISKYAFIFNLFCYTEERAEVMEAAEATARAFVCPITQVVMADPVTALDGRVSICMPDMSGCILG
jgi:hypothetical protein